MCGENGLISQDFFKPKQIIIRLTDEPRVGCQGREDAEPGLGLAGWLEDGLAGGHWSVGSWAGVHTMGWLAGGGWGRQGMLLRLYWPSCWPATRPRHQRGSSSCAFFLWGALREMQGPRRERCSIPLRHTSNQYTPPTHPLTLTHYPSTIPPPRPFPHPPSLPPHPATARDLGRAPSAGALCGPGAAGGGTVAGDDPSLPPTRQVQGHRHQGACGAAAGHPVPRTARRLEG